MNLLEDPLICTTHTGTGVGDLEIPVDVDYDTKRSLWVALPDSIELDNDKVEVCWDLAKLMDPTKWGGATVTNVEIEFTHGPAPLDPKLGPFVSTSLDLMSEVLTGKYRNQLYGDCYRYNLWVTVNNQRRRVFPIDPQIDNLAPPGLVHPDPGSGSES